MRRKSKKSPPRKRSERFGSIALASFLAVASLRAKDPPQVTPTPDPALELSPAQDRAVQQVADYFDQTEKPIRARLKTTQDDYNLALKAKPVDQSTLQAKAAAVQKATALLAAEEALHRANVLTLLTPAQREMVIKLALTGKLPGEKEWSKVKDHAH